MPTGAEQQQQQQQQGSEAGGKQKEVSRISSLSPKTLNHVASTNTSSSLLLAKTQQRKQIQIPTGAKQQQRQESEVGDKRKEVSTISSPATAKTLNNMALTKISCSSLSSKMQPQKKMQIPTGAKQQPGQRQESEAGGNRKEVSTILSSSTPKTLNMGLKKSSSSLSAKMQHQKQTPVKAKVTNRLGIPMRWLKPKAKPKPVIKEPPPPPKPDASKSTKISSKAEITKKSSTNHRKPSSPSNRLVTDSSEGSSSIVSYRNNSNAQITKSKSSTIHGSKKHKGGSVPAAIVTKKTKQKTYKKAAKYNLSESEDVSEAREEEWDSDAESEPEENDSSESDTDDDEVFHWASKMLGVHANIPSSVAATESKDSSDPDNCSNSNNSNRNEFSYKPKSPKLKIRLSTALKIKLSESIKSTAANSKDLSEEDNKKIQAALKKLERKKKKDEKLKALSEMINEQPEFDHEKARLEIKEDRRKREEAKPLTAKQIRRILREDTSSRGGGDESNWVRRSRRQPSKALLNSKSVRVLVDKLKNNDIDMRVLKMKKHINDPNAPCAVLDAILGAMEENTNCEAVYIQNFNEGMRDNQVLHLLRILQQSSCNIWCLNIGENYNVSDETWETFTKGLIHTKVTHMYASEHTITTDMKDEIRFTIRENRKKHDMHINPNNLDVIIQCTHCWWNPINAKVLRPYLKKKGYEHMLKDKEAQGLQGSTSMAPSK